MNIIIDLDLQQAVQGFGSRQPALPIQVKSQDTPTVALYFVRGNVTYDLGASPGLRFGVYVAGNPNPLVQQNTFTRTTDNLARTVYVAYPNFNTVQMQAAIGSQPQLSVIGEIRYQTTFGTIARTADIDFTVVRSLLNETVMDNLIAAFTVPAVNANVTVRINNAGWLSAGLNISIAAGAGAYQVVSVTNVTDFVAKNLGGASNAASGTTIPSGTSVGIAPVNVLQAYPDPSIIEVTTHKNQPSGYAGLDSSGNITAPVAGVELTAHKNVASGYPGLSSSALINPVQVPIDGTSIKVVGGVLTAPTGGSGDMTKAVYDTNNDNIVDHAALADTLSTAAGTLGTLTQVWGKDGSGNQGLFASPTGGGVGDMTKAVYDPDNSGTVEAADALTTDSGVGTTATQIWGKDSTGKQGLFPAPTGGGGGISDAPSDGNVYGRQNAAWTVVGSTTGGSTILTPDQGIEWFEHFDRAQYTNNWSTAKSTAAAFTFPGTFQVDATHKVLGSIDMALGSGASQNIQLWYGPPTPQTYWPGQGICTFESRICLQSVAGSSPSDYPKWVIGVTDINAIAQGNGGYWFEYNWSSSELGNGNWILKGFANTVGTIRVDSGTPADGNWHKLKIVIAADWNSAQFYIDGVSKGTVSLAGNTGQGINNPVAGFYGWHQAGTTTAWHMSADWTHFKYANPT